MQRLDEVDFFFVLKLFPEKRTSISPTAKHHSPQGYIISEGNIICRRQASLPPQAARGAKPRPRTGWGSPAGSPRFVFCLQKTKPSPPRSYGCSAHFAEKRKFKDFGLKSFDLTGERSFLLWGFRKRRPFVSLPVVRGGGTACPTAVTEGIDRERETFCFGTFGQPHPPLRGPPSPSRGRLETCGPLPLPHYPRGNG